MSLLDEVKTACVLFDKVRKSDGEGGWITTWTEGAKFQAAMTLDTTIEARVAEKQGFTGVYTVTTNKGAKLEYHDVFKRLMDGKVFRVTSDGDDKQSPARATFSISQVTAEEYEIPGVIE